MDNICELGNGHFSRIVAAKIKNEKCHQIDEDLNGIVALKIYDRNSDIVKAKAKYIMQEKKVMERLSLCHSITMSKYFIKLIKTIKDDTSLQFVMTAALGGNLNRHLQQQVKNNLNCFTPEVSLKYIAEIFSALRFMSKYGCIHRDIKTSNCLLDHQGHISLCDFGSGNILFDIEDYGRIIEDKPQNAPRAYTMVGTPHIMAPECFQRTIGHSLNCDWWSAGALLYELVSGVPLLPHLVDSSLESIERKIILEVKNTKESDNNGDNSNKNISQDFESKGTFNDTIYNHLSLFLVKFDNSFHAAFDNLHSTSTMCDSLESKSRVVSRVKKEDMQDLICQLMHINPSKRLGVWRWNDITSHPAFNSCDIDWEAVENGSSAPPRLNFDHRLGAMDILDARTDQEQKEDQLTEDQQALFSTF